jgi:regulator of protease activity HflC (stomatin/prohibitin superfamily)
MRALVLLSLLATAACASHSTSATEVGVRVNKLSGVDKNVYPPAGTYFFLPFINDWYTFSRETKRLEMKGARNPKTGAPGEDVEFKTRDGNDVGVDVTVLYRIDEQKAVHLLEMVATSDEDLREKIVRPLARTLVRDALNTVSSEEIYTNKKFDAGKTAQEHLNAELAPYGVVCESVTLGDHRFNDKYQDAIVKKKKYDQMVNTNASATKSMKGQWEAALEKVRGDVKQQIAAEEGVAAKVRLAADAYYFAKQKEAESILAEKTAQSKGIVELNRAMASAGGRTNVKLQIAKSLAGKRIVVLPSGGGGQLQKLDVNELLKTVMAQEAVKSSGKSASTTE